MLTNIMHIVHYLYAQLYNTSPDRQVLYFPEATAGLNYLQREYELAPLQALSAAWEYTLAPLQALSATQEEEHPKV